MAHAAGNPPEMTLGLRMKIARLSRRLKLSDVEEATGIPNSTLSRYETDRAVPPANRLLLLARLYEVEPNDLLNWDSAKGRLLDPAA